MADEARPWPRWPSLTGWTKDATHVEQWRRRLGFTRLGRWYTALTVGIGMAAINTGNNLLFLVLGLLLASILVSGVLSELTLEDLRVERRLPQVASVGQPCLVGLWTHNGKRRAPSFAIELREEGGDVDGRAFVLALAPGEATEAGYQLVPERRGRHRFVRLELATRSPFGLFEKARPVEAPGELVVFPRVVAADTATARRMGRDGEQPQNRAGQGQEVHGLREHRPGEDVRSIHWRSTARAGRLIGVEREQERRRRICVVLDSRALTGEPLERAVEQAAALLTRALAEGCEAGLSLPGQYLQPAAGPVHEHAALRALALLEPGGPPPAQPAGVELWVAA